MHSDTNIEGDHECLECRRYARDLAARRKTITELESKLEGSSMLVREIVAWFDVLDSAETKGIPEWPRDWLRRARASVSGAGDTDQSGPCGAMYSATPDYRCTLENDHAGPHNMVKR